MPGQQIDPTTTKFVIDDDGNFTAVDITTEQPLGTGALPGASIGNLDPQIEDPFGRGSGDPSLVESLQGIFSGETPGASLRDLLIGGPQERARMGRQATQGVEDIRDITALALPAVTGAATGGMSLPAGAGLTGLAGMLGQAIRSGDFSEEGLVDILAEGGIEAAIEAITRIPRVGPSLIRSGVRMSGDPGVAEDFAREVGRPGHEAVEALGQAIGGGPGPRLAPGSSLTPSSGRRVGARRAEVLQDLERGGGEDIVRRSQISQPISAEKQRLLKKSEDPNALAQTSRRLLDQVRSGFGQTIPFQQGLDIAQGSRLSSGVTEAAQLQNARTQAFRDAVARNTPEGSTGGGSEYALELGALERAIQELSPQAGVFGRGTRGDILAAVGAGATGATVAGLSGGDPTTTALMAILGANAIAPRNLVRAGRFANQIAPLGAPIAAGTRLERERRRQLTP